MRALLGQESGESLVFSFVLFLLSCSFGGFFFSSGLTSLVMAAGRHMALRRITAEILSTERYICKSPAAVVANLGLYDVEHTYLSLSLFSQGINLVSVCIFRTLFGLFVCVRLGFDGNGVVQGPLCVTLLSGTKRLIPFGLQEWLPVLGPTWSGAHQTT